MGLGGCTYVVCLPGETLQLSAFDDSNGSGTKLSAQSSLFHVQKTHMTPSPRAAHKAMRFWSDICSFIKTVAG
jgi:hypothetical protein